MPVAAPSAPRAWASLTQWIVFDECFSGDPGSLGLVTFLEVCLNTTKKVKVRRSLFKRNTRQFLYWIIHASNLVLKKQTASQDGPSPSALNTSGQTTVAGLVTMAEAVGKHMSPVPPTILCLVRNIIAARSAFNAAFKQYAAANPDVEVEKSNASHEFFIQALLKVLKALGGEEDAAGANKQAAGEDIPLKPSDDIEFDDAVFANMFSALNVEKTAGGASSDEGSDEEAGPTAGSTARPRRAQAKPGKGKKSKKGRRPPKKGGAQKTPPVAKAADLEEVPMESYRIIEDEEGVMTEYLMAVYSLAQDWSRLRSCIQDFWREVAYGGLNGAVAGVLSYLAVNMVKQIELDIFIEFPGHDAYETVMQTITRGDVAKAQGMFSMRLHRVDGSGESQQVEEAHVDVEEQFLIHAYRDLLDFVTDYQKTRSGKPTKSMLAEIDNWDPNFAPQRATREQRLKWRRSYTINWLYDLVNVFSGVVVQRIRLKGERHLLERVNWPGTDVRKKILPHHVFQLQCIMDAFTVSRGRSPKAFRGHVLKAPPRGFRPRRDVDLFLDRNNERQTNGFLGAVDVLRQILDMDLKKRKMGARQEAGYELLKGLQD
ncbi:hypothetical protein SPI_05432 [Niveomyces insectorum RCEF 264]|uniref:DUF6604 domain-containing protein n=1 Tax=Niveomyces insectorum RCEF 264 TaxID=1081102 RepID=A0A167T7V3_9HYPO|nr:hypothetical protein SPI_05432 [Niveomyces insectorum RCEF 264]